MRGDELLAALESAQAMVSDSRRSMGLLDEQLSALETLLTRAHSALRDAWEEAETYRLRAEAAEMELAKVGYRRPVTRGSRRRRPLRRLRRAIGASRDDSL